jgi:hypothetical protein
MSALGYRTQEPGDLTRESPRLIPALVTRLRHDQGYQPGQLAAAAGLLEDEFTRLYVRDDPAAPGSGEVTR